MKTVVIGNSGSGKTWLANELAKRISISVIHLDEIFWEPGGFDKKREPNVIQELVEISKNTNEWVAEGVFGELAELYIPDADALIWLDIPWEVCHERLKRRGSESKQHLNRVQSEAGLAKLVEWAQGYYNRTDLRSHIGHQKLFDAYRGRRMRFTTQTEVQSFLHDIQHCAAVGRACAPLS